MLVKCVTQRIIHHGELRYFDNLIIGKNYEVIKTNHYSNSDKEFYYILVENFKAYYPKALFTPVFEIRDNTLGEILSTEESASSDQLD